MSIKYSKNELLKMINSELLDLSEKEIITLINNELNKDTNKIDMDYVDMCYELLEFKRNNKHNSLPMLKSKKLAKISLIAAIIVVVTISTLTVSAQIFNFNIPQKIASLINGNAEIDMSFDFVNTYAETYDLTNSKLAEDLEKNNIAPITFPNKMTESSCIISNISYSSNENNISSDATVEFKYKNFYGNMIVRQYNDDYVFEGSITEMDVISGQMINSNGMDVLILERDDSCSIIYRDNKTEYIIYLESNISTAMEFAKSIT